MEMIRTESEYKIAVERAREDTQVMEQQRQGFAAQGFAADDIEFLMQASLSFHAQLVDEITFYENLRRGNALPAMRIGEIGRLLIALRISHDLSQKDLAARLGVSEAQVSRDERNEYRGITVERVQRILDAMEATVEARALQSSEAESEYVVPHSIGVIADPNVVIG